MRFLVLGATGMAGHLVCAYLLEKGHDVTGTFRREVPVLEKLRSMGLNAAPLDATDPAQISGAVDANSYEVVVNCIGLLNRSCDKQPALAVRLNSLLPHRLEAITAGSNCRVIQISTDCVFAGNTGPYFVRSEPDGPSLYDLTKAAGEINNGKDLTLRQSIVGPDPDPAGIGLLNWFMAQSGPINGYTHAMWTGLTTLELARAVEACAGAGAVGLLNMVPPENISKYDLLRLFNRELRGGVIEINASNEVMIDKTLVQGDGLTWFAPAPYEQQVADLGRWMRSHSEFYPQYDIAAGVR